MTPTPPLNSGRQPPFKTLSSRLLAMRRPRLWAALVLVAVSGALLAWALNTQKNQELQAGKRLTASYARVIEEQTTRTLQTVDQRLQLAALDLADLEAYGLLNPGSARTILREHRESVPFVRAIWVLDAQGRIVYDSDEGNIGLGLGDRPYFKVYEDKPNTGFHLSPPVRSRTTGTWMIPATRPFHKADSSFDGIIVAAVEPPYFDQVWRTMELGQGGSVALTTRAGVLMMRTPHRDDAMGMDLQERPLFKDLIHKTAVGDYLDASGVDAVERLFAYRTLKEYPDFVVVVGQASDFVLAPWRRFATLATLIWLAASLAILAFAMLLDQAWRQRERERALSEQAAQRLALATNAASIGVWEWDLAADHWEATSTYYTMMGYEPPSKSDTDRTAWLEQLHPDDRARCAAHIQNVLAGQTEDYDEEYRRMHADGSYRWLNIVGKVLARDAAGRPSRIIGVQVDNTQSKQAQETRRQVLERVTDAFVAMDPDWVYTFVNEQAAAMLGKDVNGLIGQKMWDVCPELVGLPLHQACLQAMADQQPAHVEAYYAPDQRWFENHVYPSPEGITLYFQDITPRKRAEQALQDSEDNLRITLQSIGDAVIATDQLGRITRMNPAAERLTAWPLADALGQPLTNVFRIINAKTRAPAVDPVEVVIRTGEVVGLANHTALLARDGQEYQIFDSAAPMHDASGAIIGVVLVFSDVTEAYRVNEALAQTTRLLEQTGEMAKVGGWTLDLQTQKFTFSKESWRIIDTAPGADVPLENALKSYPESARALITEAFQRAVEAGTPFDLELPFTTPLGRTVWTRTQGTVIYEGDRVVKFQGAFQDITQRKLAELAMKESETRFRNLVEWMPEAIAVHRDGIILYVNPAAIRLFGATSDQQLVGQSALSCVHPEDRPGVAQRIESISHFGGSAPLVNSRFLQLDGTVIDVQVQGTQIMYDGAPAVQTVMRDVTARMRSERVAQRAQEALNQAAHHTKTILDNLMDGVITIDQQGRVESINHAACALFGYTPDEVLGRNVSMLTPETHRSQHDGYLERYLSTGQAHIMGKLTEVEGLRKDGSLFPMSLQLSEIVNGESTTFIGIARDITQHRQDIEEIRRLAFYDSLTGLPNRRLLLDRLRQAMHTSNRSGHHGALMFLDLDHFKQLNDTQGHDMGDQLLQQVAARIQGCARVGDSLARLGGDEFVVLLENLSPNASDAANQAEIVANKILSSFQTTFQLNGHDQESTTSIGIVVFKGELDAMDELLKKADLAMYQAKAAGRNNARFFDPAMQAAVAARDAMEKDMRDALAIRAFTLHYQIQVDHMGVIRGAEALVRWNHPTRGMVSPADFIPLAEETGLIQPLGQWVLETACAQLVDWASAENSAHWTVSVNVSALQFALPDYVQTVTAALKKTGANPRLLKLELTESMLASDVDDVVAKMRDLKSQGVSLSLDDFGTGYSSLAYLKRLPLDQIKIDQSFVRNVLTDASDAAIARTILALGRSLGLQVIAEGVETMEQRDFLDGIGCQAYQGYYFGRPVAAHLLLNSARENHDWSI